MPMRRGKRAGSKTPTVDYAAGCLVRSTSTKCPTKKSRTSSSPPISRPENAWASRPLSRRSSKSLAKTCKSGSLSLLHLDPESRNTSGRAFDPTDFTVFKGKVFFDAVDAAGKYGLWVTDGTAAGTHELTGIKGAYSASG